MELLFLALLFVIMVAALGSGFPVAFALPGAAIISIALAAGAGALFAGDSAAYFAQGSPVQWLSAGVTNLRGIYWEAERDTLIAIPLFIFMGIMLQRSKIAEDLLVTMAQLFGPIPGGLGISVVFVGALLAATTGIVGATVVAMGLISLPAMLRANYSKPLATGAIAASGTLGQIIPPSIVLIILADQLGSAVDQASTTRKELYQVATGELSMPSEFDVTSSSAGDMFLGAFIPGLVLVGLYMAFILTVALLRPTLAPAMPYEGKYDWNFAGKVALTLFPPLILIVAVLGSIIAGIATVNQAGAIGAAGAMIMAGYRLREGTKGAFWPALLAIASLVIIAIVVTVYEPNVKSIQTTDDAIGVTLGVIGVTGMLIALAWSGIRVMRIENTLQGVMVETAKTTSLVFIILLGAAMLTSAFRAFGGEELVKEFLNSLPGGFWTQFVIVMLVIFILGFFLDFIEIAVVVVPIVAPILLADPSANVTAVWLGVMIGLNIQTSFLTPPFGFALFYLRGVAPAIVRTVDIYKGVVAFITLQLVALVIVGMYPPLVNYLPTRISLTSETAPPPRNPRLQVCLESDLLADLPQVRSGVTAAVAEARALPLNLLPEDQREDLDEAFEQAIAAVGELENVAAAVATVDAAAPDYRPLHATVRAIQRDVRSEQRHLDEIVRESQFARTTGDAEAVAVFDAEIAEIEAVIAEMEAQIPETWADADGAFNELRSAETTARRQYRRAADNSATPIQELQAVLAGAGQLEALRPDIAGLLPLIRTEDPAAALEAVETLRSAVGEVEGARDIRGGLSDARRALREDTPDRAAAAAGVEAALATLDADLAWRRPAADQLSAGLAAYRTEIAKTVGMRQEPSLPRETALMLSNCLANHRNLTLNF